MNERQRRMDEVSKILGEILEYRELYCTTRNPKYKELGKEKIFEHSIYLSSNRDLVSTDPNDDELDITGMIGDIYQRMLQDFGRL